MKHKHYTLPEAKFLAQNDLIDTMNILTSWESDHNKLIAIIDDLTKRLQNNNIYVWDDDHISPCSWATKK
jgi:hypothetical protein